MNSSYLLAWHIIDAYAWLDQFSGMSSSQFAATKGLAFDRPSIISSSCCCYIISWRGRLVRAIIGTICWLFAVWLRRWGDETCYRVEPRVNGSVRAWYEGGSPARHPIIIIVIIIVIANWAWNTCMWGGITYVRGTNHGIGPAKYEAVVRTYGELVKIYKEAIVTTYHWWWKHKRVFCFWLFRECTVKYMMWYQSCKRSEQVCVDTSIVLTKICGC